MFQQDFFTVAQQNNNDNATGLRGGIVTKRQGLQKK
jgi:hypothetical protein